jgi:hypothetical protein
LHHCVQKKNDELTKHLLKRLAWILDNICFTISFICNIISSLIFMPSCHVAHDSQTIFPLGFLLFQCI